MNSISILVFIAIAIVVTEGFVLLFNKNRCPLSNWALKYTTSEKANYSLYLPEWFVPYNDATCTILFIFGVGLVVWRIL